MKIIGVSGSIRKNAYSGRALASALRIASQTGVETSLIDLRDYHLPFCDGGVDYPAYPDVSRLRHQFKSADGVVIATPEYHASISGVLKNALDLLEVEQVEGKVFALIAVLGGAGSTNALNTLRIICRQMHAWVIPEQLVIECAYEAFDAEGELRDPHLTKRMRDLVEKLCDTAFKLRKNID